MTPIAFEGHNQVYAKNQPQYLPLPAYLSHTEEGRVVTCWRLSLRERLKLLLTGRVWMQQLTFHGALQPQLPSVDSPFKRGMP